MNHQKRVRKLSALREKALDVLSRVQNLTHAAKQLGVDRSTITRWMQRPDFRADLKKRQSQQSQQSPAPTIPAEVPQGLSPAEWRERVLQLFQLDSTEILLLDRAVTALRRIRDAESLIDKEGLLLNGEPHPALKIEREQANLFRQLIKQLDFDGAEDEDADGKIVPIRKEA